MLRRGRRVVPRRIGGSSPARRPGPPGRPVGDQQRRAHQRIEQIQGGDVIIGSHDGAGALQIESPGEHRTPIQQRLFRVVEQVVGHATAWRRLWWRDRATAATRPAPQPRPRRSRHLGGVIDAIREAATSGERRDAVEPAADFHHSVRLAGPGQREVATRHLGAVEEQVHGGGFGSGVGVERRDTP